MGGIHSHSIHLFNHSVTKNSIHLCQSLSLCLVAMKPNRNANESETFTELSWVWLNWGGIKPGLRHTRFQAKNLLSPHANHSRCQEDNERDVEMKDIYK